MRKAQDTLLMTPHKTCQEQWAVLSRKNPKKGQSRKGEDMEFSGVLKKENVEIPGVN